MGQTLILSNYDITKTELIMSNWALEIKNINLHKKFIRIKMTDMKGIFVKFLGSIITT